MCSTLLSSQEVASDVDDSQRVRKRPLTCKGCQMPATTYGFTSGEWRQVRPWISCLPRLWLQHCWKTSMSIVAAAHTAVDCGLLQYSLSWKLNSGHSTVHALWFASHKWTIDQNEGSCAEASSVFCCTVLSCVTVCCWFWLFIIAFVYVLI